MVIWYIFYLKKFDANIFYIHRRLMPISLSSRYSWKALRTAQQNWRPAIHSIVRGRKVTCWRLLPLHAMAKYLKGTKEDTRSELELIVVFLVESSKWRWRMSMSTSLCGARRSTPPSWRRERWRRGSWVLLPLITTVPLSSEMFVNIQYPDRIRPSPLTSRESLATLDHCGPSKIKNIDHFISLHLTSKWNIEMVVWLGQRI